ncbi:hypothetical protein Kpol_505p36 [Vanderwaltozyma polyspora DSM 70294]|uniref:Uncharacterized protein n=1 Tax=Vanderwaltozyma polyspora (strain ATCC 22028 / DSM 70294 / BCRC 21397 / CBS 2163 / NBRC 10782 / NRRL Y-8283 / UCD 57-17) TaxID=436907 RepID=A7TNC7_VANPO|nr:uncharacterized protein Kpol_505p36 [Vanderwaltozyma polyspora DSM 70294]EDO16259.1 hypothetical protein Kpol_505p36 [Vanderwaltozyma polyspora DSM 70294]
MCIRDANLLLKLPLQYGKIKVSFDQLPNYLYDKRSNVNRGLLQFGSCQVSQLLKLSDLVIDYISCILCLFEDELSETVYNVLVDDLMLSVLNAICIYREVAIKTMETSYRSEDKDSHWSTSGVYIKKALGLLQYFKNCKITDDPTFLSILNNISVELKVVQQLGMVILVLSKLRNKIYRNTRDAVMDFHNEDINELSHSSMLYAKLVIGCKDQIAGLPRTSIINEQTHSYLEALALILLSMDQYQKDECGVAIGMINSAVNELSKIVPISKLNDSLLVKQKKTDKIKNMLKKRPSLESSNSSIIMKMTNSSPLPALLKNTLDDFVVPLTILLRYRYQQTNDNVSFKPIEKNVEVIHGLYPQGKVPQLDGTIWIFDNMVLKELNASNSSSNEVTNYY